MLSQKDVEDILGLSAIGVIPADERIVVSQNKGIPVLSMHTKATRAFMTARTGIRKSTCDSGGSE